MTQTIPLYYLLLATLALVAIYVIIRGARALMLSARRTVDAVEKNTFAIINLSSRIESDGKKVANHLADVSTHLVLVPNLLESITKIGDAQLQIMQAQRDSRKNPFGRPNGPLPPRDVDAANMEHEIAETMRAYGITREEAMLRMNGANDQSAWSDAGGVLHNWRER